MTSFGKFWFRYIAPGADNPLDPSIDFSVTAEADLPQILQVFEDFLKANKYDLDDRELTLSRKAPVFDNDDFWGDDGVSLIGNPIPGGNSDDTLFFSEQYWRNRDSFESYSNDVVILGGK